MFCKDLKVVNLNITEDNYEYKALFRLCSEEACMDVDLAALSEDAVVTEIKKIFTLEEGSDEIRKVLTEKVMEASNLESRIKEGETYGNDAKDGKIRRDIDSLSIS